MNNRAAILIITLWILTLLSTIALSITYRGRIELKMVEAQLSRAENFYIAKAGVAEALAVLDNDNNTYDALNEKWSNYTSNMYRINPFREISVGRGRFTVSYIYKRDMFTGYEQVFYGMQDEERKLNVNNATQDMLESLPGVTPQIAVSILAWRGDPALTEDILMKEDTYYNKLPKPYKRKGSAIECIEELLLVRGITQKLLFGEDTNKDGVIDINENGIAQYLTVYGNGLVNINTAGVTDLRAVGFDEDLSYKILRYRLGQDGIAGTADDRIFTGIGQIGTDLASIGESLLADEKTLLKERQKWLKVSSEYYTICVQAKIPKQGSLDIQAVLDKDADKGSQIVSWREN